MPLQPGAAPLTLGSAEGAAETAGAVRGAELPNWARAQRGAGGMEVLARQLCSEPRKARCSALSPDTPQLFPGCKCLYSNRSVYS